MGGMTIFCKSLLDPTLMELGYIYTKDIPIYPIYLISLE